MCWLPGAAGWGGWYPAGIMVLGNVAHLVLNPTAGGGRSASWRAEISHYLEGRGTKAVWHVTEDRGDAGQVVAGLSEDAAVVAVGGDGTVREVAAACVGTRRVMGVLPAGSGNDYVKALGVGTKMKVALEALAGGRVRSVDTGVANGEPFNNGLGIGFDAQVAAGVAEAPGFLGGVGRYMWSVARLLWGFECHDATLRLDGEVVTSRTILVAVALGTTYGSRFRLAPAARLDDGLFDVVWSEEVSRAEVLRLVPRALGSSLLKHPKIHMSRAREVEITFEQELPAHVDGEMLSPSRTFQAHLLPGALRVVAP